MNGYADMWVEATLPFLQPLVADMVRLQRLTGMRPGNVVAIRWIDIDCAGEIWLYRPASHKTQYLGNTLVIPLGPKAKAILFRYKHRAPHLPIFSPREAEEYRREARRQRPDRKTPIFPSEMRRREHERKVRLERHRRRQPGEAYSTDSYGRAITYAVDRAKRAGVNIVRWHPNQLRHTRATEVRRAYGLEAAQLALGHSKANVTELYAERDMEKAIEIARMMG